MVGCKYKERKNLGDFFSKIIRQMPIQSLCLSQGNSNVGHIFYRPKLPSRSQTLKRHRHHSVMRLQIGSIISVGSHRRHSTYDVCDTSCVVSLLGQLKCVLNPMPTPLSSSTEQYFLPLGSSVDFRVAITLCCHADLEPRNDVLSQSLWLLPAKVAREGPMVACRLSDTVQTEKGNTGQVVGREGNRLTDGFTCSNWLNPHARLGSIEADSPREAKAELQEQATHDSAINQGLPATYLRDADPDNASSHRRRARQRLPTRWKRVARANVSTGQRKRAQEFIDPVPCRGAVLRIGQDRCHEDMTAIP